MSEDTIFVWIEAYCLLVHNEVAGSRLTQKELAVEV